MNEVNSKHL